MSSIFRKFKIFGKCRSRSALAERLPGISQKLKTDPTESNRKERQNLAFLSI